jgi:hypothetical protein
MHIYLEAEILLFSLFYIVVLKQLLHYISKGKNVFLYGNPTKFFP